MATRIYKYTIQLHPEQYVYLPIGAEILTVAWQAANGICLWAAVDPDAEVEAWTFHVLGTGWDLVEYRAPYRLAYLGTAHAPRHVWHVFRVESDDA